MQDAPLARMYGILPAIGILLLAAVVVVIMRPRYKESKAFSWGTIIWELVFVSFLVFIAVWCSIGWFLGGRSTLVKYIIVVLFCGGTTLFRDKFFEFFDSLDGLPADALRIVRDFVLMGVSALACFVALEAPWNYHYASIDFQFVGLEWTLIFLSMLVAYFLFQRRGAGPAVVVLVCATVGIAQYYVSIFRDAAILPSDALAIGTAVEVTSRYSFALSTDAIRGIRWGAMALLPLAFVRCGVPKHSRATTRKAIAANLLASGVALAVVVGLVTLPNYREDFNVYVFEDYWPAEVLLSYQENGFLPSFIVTVQDLPIQRPEGYSNETARALQASLALEWSNKKEVVQRREQSTQQFETIKPSIVVIQNESFSDLSEYNGLGDGYLGPMYFTTGIPDALSRGLFAVSTNGGGTCNAEFEFLTGNALAYIGAGKYPFVMYDMGDIDTLPKQLAQHGYHSIGIHPNIPENWDRSLVYADFGFDEFLTLSDFAGAEEFHDAVSDWATYDRILELLSSNEAPQFIFDVTMQNHGGYEQGNVPDDEMGHYQNDAVPEIDNIWANEFVGCIEESDRALKRFVDELSQLDRPVLLLFFGDHQPFFTGYLNDQTFPDESDELVHTERIFHTDYIMWANYSIEGDNQIVDVDDTSACFLAAMALDAIGAPLSEFQQAQLAVRADILAINNYGYLGHDGNWYNLEDGPYKKAYDDLALVQYLNFAEKI